MTKKTRVMIVLAVILIFAGCGRKGGNVDNVQILEWESAIYSDDDIEAAFQTAKDYFSSYEDCTLTELYYSGDDHADEFNEIAERRNYDEAIIILSTFDTGSSSFYDGFNNNSTYYDWNFILVRNAGEGWKVFDAGY